MKDWLIADVSLLDVHFQAWMLVVLGIPPGVGSSPFGQREVFAKVLALDVGAAAPSEHTATSGVIL